MLKLFTVTLILASLVLYFLSIPVGMGLFVTEVFLKNSSRPGAQSSIYIPYLLAELVYILCFIVAWKSGERFRESLFEFLHKPVVFTFGNFLFLMPIISSLTHVTLNVVELIQESFLISTRIPPISPDPILAYVELALASIFEEIIFRVFPLGIFYAFYLNKYNIRKNLSIPLISLLSPEHVKGLLRSMGSFKLTRKIELDEWLVILLSSALFALSHYLTPNTWEVGKLTLSFIQGIVMALSYVLYGIHASILIHWYFNYYLYTYRLTAVLQPSISFLSLSCESLPIALTVLILVLFVLLNVKGVRTLILPILYKKCERIFKALRSRFQAALNKKILTSKIDVKAIPELALLTIIFLTLGLRLAILEYPKRETSGGTISWDLIFDEKYYVNAARDLLHGKATNNEHPPLAKVFIVLSIMLLGDNPVGWRISAISASLASVLLVYALSFILSGSRDISLCSATLFAFDIMAFNIGQIALLDAPAMTFVLLSSALILRGRYDLAGIFLGLASLCKLSSVFVYFGIVIYVALTTDHKKRALKEVITSCLRCAVIAFVIFLVGLWIYDSYYSSFAGNPLGHISYMFAYHGSLEYQDPKEVILPLQWINPLDPFVPMPFYVMTTKEVIGGVLREYNTVAYYGIYTPLWWGIWIFVPTSLFHIFKEANSGDFDRSSLFGLTWTLASFLPYVLLAYLMSRWVYPFYFYSTLPGLYVGLSGYLKRGKYAKLLRATILIIQAFWFILWFPVKPKPLIDLFMFFGLPV